MLSVALGPQGIEPRSVVPETTVLSVELQARFSVQYTVSSIQTYCARGIVAAATGGAVSPESSRNQGPITIPEPFGATSFKLVLLLPGRAVGRKSSGAFALADSGGLARGLVEVFLESEPLFTLGWCDTNAGPVL